jgi:hypothetical protein
MEMIHLPCTKIKATDSAATSTYLAVILDCPNHSESDNNKQMNSRRLIIEAQSNNTALKHGGIRNQFMLACNCVNRNRELQPEHWLASRSHNYLVSDGSRRKTWKVPSLNKGLFEG